MKNETIKELEKKFINLQSHKPPYTDEELQYLLKEDGHNLTLKEIGVWAKKVKETVEIKKKVDSKRSKRKQEDLVNTLNDVITTLKKKAEELKGTEETGLVVRIMKEIRRSIMDISRLTGELKKTESGGISKFYIPINELKDFLKKEKKKWKKKMKESEKKG